MASTPQLDLSVVGDRLEPCTSLTVVPPVVVPPSFHAVLITHHTKERLLPELSPLVVEYYGPWQRRIDETAVRTIALANHNWPKWFELASIRIEALTWLRTHDLCTSLWCAHVMDIDLRNACGIRSTKLIFPQTVPECVRYFETVKRGSERRVEHRLWPGHVEHRMKQERARQCFVAMITRADPVIVNLILVYTLAVPARAKWPPHPHDDKRLTYPRDHPLNNEALEAGLAYGTEGDIFVEFDSS